MRDINTYISEKLVISKSSINKTRKRDLPDDLEDIRYWEEGDIIYYITNYGAVLQFAKLKKIDNKRGGSVFVDIFKDNIEVEDNKYIPDENTLVPGYGLIASDYNIPISGYYAKLWDGEPKSK